MAFKGPVYGTVEGTGSAINVILGFVPDYVKVYNYDDAGSAAPTMEWFSGMTDGHGLKNTTDTQAKVTSGGISAYDGTAAGFGKGFTIGTDTDINQSAETLFYIAFRNE